MPVEFTEALQQRLGRAAQFGPENTLLGQHDLVEPATAHPESTFGGVRPVDQEYPHLGLIEKTRARVPRNGRAHGWGRMPFSARSSVHIHALAWPWRAPSENVDYRTARHAARRGAKGPKAPPRVPQAAPKAIVAYTLQLRVHFDVGQASTAIIARGIDRTGRASSLDDQGIPEF